MIPPLFRWPNSVCHYTSTHHTQQEAIDAGRTIAQNQGSELVIHRPNGQIRDKDSHGKDPYPPKG
ncbi:DUF2188 domain-containing protein [Serratia sp. NPDC078593]|uniref:DUF2188 domain-containing protein n=1 Tax=unclassified Serratia (in: enterobacteria) TaxID=2647522 RepID=UPI003D041C60